MEKLFTVEIYTPDRLFFRGEVESLVVNTIRGHFGVRYNTTPIVTMLFPGIIKILHKNKWAEAVNTDGIITVKKNHVTILSDKCLWPHEVLADKEAEEKEESYMESKERREQTLRDYNMAKAQLAMQFAKLKKKTDL